jgi:hypothetical protein
LLLMAVLSLSGYGSLVRASAADVEGERSRDR